MPAHELALGYQLQLTDERLFFVDVVHNRGENLTRLRNLTAAEYPVDPNNVVIRTQAEADAKTYPITNGGATINGQRVTGIAETLSLVRMKGNQGITQ
jgi:hypothetical protein